MRERSRNVGSGPVGLGKGSVWRRLWVGALVFTFFSGSVPASGLDEPLARGALPLTEGFATVPTAAAEGEGQQTVTEAEVEEAIATLRCEQTPFFWCAGGIGVEERVALQRLRDRFTVCVEWAQKERPYLADATLTLENDSGAVVWQGRGLGPLWCAQLPTGRYRLVAAALPVVEYPPQDRWVEVTPQASLRRVAFLW
ncbi:hypothetical protein [Hydrogenophilus thiooxidans]|uniref:hypothetical protein n=1 Tax=Hydrogenophilus thiooxidans TaxID=2820326 RepID=UPI001C2446DC|nr:hypothetical protein [Hydrogenophilus thiooxidans]